MAPSDGTTSTPLNLVVTLPNHSTLQWHPNDGTQQWHDVHCTLQWHPGATSNPPKWFVALPPVLEVRTPIAIAIWGKIAHHDLTPIFLPSGAWFGLCCPTLPSPCKPQPQAMAIWKTSSHPSADLTMAKAATKLAKIIVAPGIELCKRDTNSLLPCVVVIFFVSMYLWQIKWMIQMHSNAIFSSTGYNIHSRYCHDSFLIRKKGFFSTCLSFFCQSAHVLVASGNSNNFQTLGIFAGSALHGFFKKFLKSTMKSTMKSTLQGTNISPFKGHLWRWFSFSWGGICDRSLGGTIFVVSPSGPSLLLIHSHCTSKPTKQPKKKSTHLNDHRNWLVWVTQILQSFFFCRLERVEDLAMSRWRALGS